MTRNAITVVKPGELDALSPTVIVDLVRVAVMDLMDADLWERAEKREQCNIRLIGDTAAN